MKRDLLDEATRALRESAEPPPPRPEETRARVMTSLRRQRARRTSIVKAALPLAAVLVGSIAWAAASGRLPTSLDAAVTRLGAPGPSVGARPSAAPLAAPIASSSAEAAAVDPPAEPTPVLEQAASNGVEPTPSAHPVDRAPPAANRAPRPAPSSAEKKPLEARAPRAVDAATPIAPAASIELDEQLYTAAHRLHFVERNPGAALVAWDAYLGAAPRGRLAVEARYNRALCLVRLGRTAEARRALEGFASGAYGGYRQAEARALLDATGGAATP